MAEPKCPQCSTEGIEHIVSKDSAEKSRQGKSWFNVAHCDQCGHIYGVFSKYIMGVNPGPTLVVPERKR